MEKLLSNAGLPEAWEVERLRKQVMGMSEPQSTEPVVSPDVKSEPKVHNKEPAHRPRVTLAEVVRQEVIDHWFTPARSRGEREVTVVSGDVHKQLKWQNRHPAVCGALMYRREEFAQRAKVELIRVVGKNPSNTTKFVYRLL